MQGQQDLEYLMSTAKDCNTSDSPLCVPHKGEEGAVEEIFPKTNWSYHLKVNYKNGFVFGLKKSLQRRF